MNLFLNDIRCAENPISGNRKIINTIAAFFLGIALGIFSKFLDFRQAQLPGVLMAIDGALDIHNCIVYFCLQQFCNQSKRECFCVFSRHGYELLFVFKLCRRLFSKKLRYDLVWIYHDFSVFGIYLLVCERKKQIGMDAVSVDFGSIVQHDFCIWMGIFRSTLYFGIGSLYDRSCCFKEGHTERFCANGKR